MPPIRDADSLITTLQQLFLQGGGDVYLGEAVTQQQHALQAAWLAECAGADSRLITAALLHDLGHLLEKAADRPDVDQRHEQLAESFLRPLFDQRVLQPIALHVAAKRYLCAVEADYLALLSDASQHSLQLQGGPFDDRQVHLFRRHRYHACVLQVRRWDDLAKQPDRLTPPLEHFWPHVRAAWCSARGGAFPRLASPT